MHRNIKHLQWILPLYEAWFWLGIWVPYYLLFTNYAGIGLIEGAMVITLFLFEIPTGVFADLFGRKKTLILAYLLITVGNIVMTMANGTAMIVISVMTLSFAYALISGTSDALLYDSLKVGKQEGKFDIILSRIKTYGLITMAVCSLIGGFAYAYNPRFPFLLTTIAGFVGFIGTFFLSEVQEFTHQEKPTLKSISIQMRDGAAHLFQIRKGGIVIIWIFLLASFSRNLIEMLDPALALQFGYSETGLGILYAIIPIVSALGTFFYPQIKKISHLKGRKVFMIFTFFIVTAISPYVGIIIGTGALFYRNIFYRVIDLVASDSINKFIDSKYRATTLSSFNMLVSLPYVVLAFLIGYWVDQSSAGKTALYLTIVFSIIWLLSLLVQFVQTRFITHR